MPDDPEDLTPEDALQAARDELAALRKEREALALDNAMLSAGVDLASKTGQMFRKAWDGDADVDKIKAEAADIVGVLKPTVAPVADGADEDGHVREPGETDQLDERAAFGSEGGAGAPDVNPATEAWRQLDGEIAAGARLENAASGALHVLTAAAMTGDERVMAKH